MRALFAADNPPGGMFPELIRERIDVLLLEIALTVLNSVPWQLAQLPEKKVFA